MKRVQYLRLRHVAHGFYAVKTRGLHRFEFVKDAAMELDGLVHDALAELAWRRWAGKRLAPGDERAESRTGFYECASIHEVPFHHIRLSVSKRPAVSFKATPVSFRLRASVVRNANL